MLQYSLFKDFNFQCSLQLRTHKGQLYDKFTHEKFPNNVRMDEASMHLFEQTTMTMA